MPTATLVGHRYRLIEPIAKGGMAVVWRATDTRLGRQVAVKVLHDRFADDPNFLERFRREAVAAASFNHPNIVTVFDFGEDDETHYLVMELVEGPSLARLMGPTGRLRPTEVVTVLRSVLAGLSYAHDHGVVHRDIKPANILVAPDQIKLGDFGIARAFASSDLTATGAIIGTASYLAPEQAEGKRVDHRADLYALGCVAYRCLAGRLPWSADTEVGVALARTLRPPDALAPLAPDAPRRLIQIVEGALARDPAARYQSADAMREALHGLKGTRLDLTPRSPHPTSRATATPPPRRSSSRPRPVVNEVGPNAARRAPAARESVRQRPAAVGTMTPPPRRAVARPAESQPSWHSNEHPSLDTSGRERRAASRERAAAHARQVRTMRRVLTAATGAVALVTVLVLAGGALSSSAPASSSSKSDAGPSTTARTDRSPSKSKSDATSPTAESGPVTPVDAFDFDPFAPDGVKVENPAQATLAIDGDTATAWTTDAYATREFGRTKSGVGLIVDLGKSRRPGVVSVDVTPGSSFELRAADQRSDRLDGFALVPNSSRTEVLATGTNGTAKLATVTVPTGEVSARYWVVWFTRLPPGRAGEFRGSVFEVRFGDV